MISEKKMLLFLLAMIDGSDGKDKLERLYNRYKKKMIYSAYQILHNMYDAEDAVSEAIISVANNIENVPDADTEAALSYMCRAARSRAINILEARNRRKAHEESLDSENDAVSDETDIEIPDTAEYDRIVSCIRSLPDIYGDVLYLHFVQNLSAGEISVQLGRSIHTVRQQLVRGKKLLTAVLKKEGIIQ